MECLKISIAVFMEEEEKQIFICLHVGAKSERHEAKQDTLNVYHKMVRLKLLTYVDSG